MKNILPSLFLFVFFSSSLCASNSHLPTQEFQALNQDTIYVYKRGTNGLIIIPPVEWEPFNYDVTFRDTIIYEPAFLPVVFDGKILPSNLDFLPKNNIEKKNRLTLIPRDSTLVPFIKKTQEVQAKRRNFYLDIGNIENVRYTVTDLKKIPKFDEEKVTKRNVINELIATEDIKKVELLEFEKIEPEFRYWKRNGEHELQVSQTFISENWHQGGNKNFALRSYQKVTMNYEKNKLTFGNLLEWKLNFMSTPADKINSINIVEDQVRMVNDLGYKAFDKWRYSTSLETKTQLFTSHPLNSEDINVALLSPFTTNLGIGMSYNLDKSFQNNRTKKLKYAMQLSPFSLKYILIRDHDVNPNKGGLEEGKYSKLEAGSKVDANLAFQFNLFLTWESRAQYYTNYHGTLFEFENKFIMKLNRYFATQVYVNLRFDDQGAKGSNGYLQTYESLLFGLSYKW